MSVVFIEVINLVTIIPEQEGRQIKTFVFERQIDAHLKIRDRASNVCAIFVVNYVIAIQIFKFPTSYSGTCISRTIINFSLVIIKTVNDVTVECTHWMAGFNSYRSEMSWKVIPTFLKASNGI